MIHIDRRHPEIGGAANPIRQAKSLENIPNDMKPNTNHESSRTDEGWKYHLTSDNPYLAGVSTSHTAYGSVMPFYNSPIESLLKWYEVRHKELEAKLRESERSPTRELLEVYQTVLKINEIENRKRMGGNLGLDTMNEVSSLIAVGILTPVISTDKEGTISRRFEPRNRENVGNTLSTIQNNLSGPIIQGMLAILKKQAEFADNVVKYMEITKRNQDVRDEELARMLFGLGRVKDSQANYSKAEQLRIEYKPEVVSRVLSGGGEKNDSLHDGQEEKSSRKELGQTDCVNLSGPIFEMSSSDPRLPPPPPVGSALFNDKSTQSQMSSRELEPFGKLIGQDEIQQKTPNQHFSTLLQSQDQFAPSQDHGVQRVRVADELAKEDQVVEEARRTQIRAIQERDNRKTGEHSIGNDSSLYEGPVTGKKDQANHISSP
jgi:hypothetical protein